FIKGPKWYDFDGKIHSLHLNSPVIQEWCAQYPTFHPIISAEFGWEMQCFRNTVRLSKPDFPVRLNSLITNNKPLQSLKIHTAKLDKADFYTNVAYLFQHILKRVLFDIRKRDISAEIMISYDRSVWNEYRLHHLRVVHRYSEANPLDMVQDKLKSGGGDMYELAKLCAGYCDWSVEGSFEGDMKRWRILNFRNLPEVEDIGKVDDADDGFTHVFTFYKYR
ncbi:MAG: hypothetical protein K2G29_09935, partial [Muribaculaceae bacterium]|nr:hypothetical protein [Muribaculaceae bacterium]